MLESFAYDIQMVWFPIVGKLKMPSEVWTNRDINKYIYFMYTSVNLFFEFIIIIIETFPNFSK